jgi:hypothetical protein
MAGKQLPFQSPLAQLATPTNQSGNTSGGGLYGLLGGILDAEELAYVRSLVVGSDGGPKAPTPDLSRSVYQYTAEQIDADINEVARKVLGREIIEADREAEWYQDLTTGLNKMFSKGTVTTTKLVKNKKTGKLEQITTQIPKFTTEQKTAAITEAVSEADPEALERKKRLDFAGWMIGKMGGGQ